MKKAQIKDFPNYIITDTGDVYSCNGRWDKDIKKIKPWKNRFGYFMVTFSKNGKHFHKSIHRLVASAVSPNPENKPQVNHKNGIKTDNRLCNLEWNTRSENMQHAYRVIKTAHSPRYWKNKFGKDNPNSKIVLQIKDDKIIAEFYGAAEANRKTGIDFRYISACCRGKQKTAGKYGWKFKE